MDLVSESGLKLTKQVPNKKWIWNQNRYLKNGSGSTMIPVRNRHVCNPNPNLICLYWRDRRNVHIQQVSCRIFLLKSLGALICGRISSSGQVGHTSVPKKSDFRGIHFIQLNNHEEVGGSRWQSQLGWLEGIDVQFGLVRCLTQLSCRGQEAFLCPCGRIYPQTLWWLYHQFGQPNLFN